MDRDRYKKASPKPTPKKRSINGEETYNLRHQPIIIKPQHTESVESDLVQAPKPILKPKQQVIKPKQPLPVAKKEEQALKPSVEAKLPPLFDEDDEDLFGVWKTQKDIKKARQEQEAKDRATKLAAKLLKKEQKKAQKRNRAIAKKTAKSGRKKYYAIGAALILVPVCFFTASFFIHNDQSAEDTTTDVLGQTTVAAKPDFSILKPTTTENQATEPKYDTKKKVVSYNDILADVPITVSQQPLPSAFIADPTGQVEKLAKQINANDKISTSDTTAYAGISIKGPQTVVFTKNDLLIFIIANKKIDTLDWIKYIEKMI